MLRRGSITVEMAKAGPQFCSEFSRAYLDPLQAADIGRVPVSGRRIHECSCHIESARERAWAALEAVGGLASPPIECLVHGFEHRRMVAHPEVSLEHQTVTWSCKR